MTDGELISVRVTPRSKKDEVAGWQEDVLRVRLRAPPLESRANEALIRLLALRLGLALSDVEIVAGETGRTKRLRLKGLDRAEVKAKLTRDPA